MIENLFGAQFDKLENVHRKNSFAERSEILTGYRKLIFLNCQNNFVGRSN